MSDAPVHVREAEPAEYQRVADLTEAAYGSLPRAPSAEYAARMLLVMERAAQATILVAVDERDAVVGSVTLVLDPGPFFEFRYGIDGDASFRLLAVHPDSFGRGVGRALVDECLRRAREAGRSRMIICTMPWMTTAQRMYEAMGFVRLPELDVPFADDRICRTYALDLAAP